MKKFLLTFVALTFCFVNLTAQVRDINKEELPKNAQQFINKHYAQEKISIATMEKEGISKEYKVILNDGTKVEFDKKGNWKNINSKRDGSVPKAIVPTEIAKYVESKFPKSKIVNIDKDKKGYEVELDNGVELEFNSKYKLIKTDR
ncbi:MAG: PepSY-like domain-containing protein [Bacteroidales bacterium]